MKVINERKKEWFPSESQNDKNKKIFMQIIYIYFGMR